MTLKVIIAVAVLAVCVQARPGGPAAYSISAPSVDHASVGKTHEHTVKGHYGQSSQSDYTSEVQTAHSQSHVHRTSISNDAGHGAGNAVAAISGVSGTHGYAAPVSTLYAHSFAPAPLDYGYHYGSSAQSEHEYSIPSTLNYGTGYKYGNDYAPALGLGYSYASSPALSHATPIVMNGAYNFGYYAAPSHSHIALASGGVQSYGPAILGHAAHGYAPAIAHYAAPLLKTAVAAVPAYGHTSLGGGHYGY